MTLNRSNLCWLALALITAGYLLFWALLLGATATYSTPDSWLKVLMSPEIRHATWLSLVTCSLAAGFCAAAGGAGGVSDVAPGVSREVLAGCGAGHPDHPAAAGGGAVPLDFFPDADRKVIERGIPFTYQVSGVVLAQFVVAAAFAIRTMRGTFQHLSARPEDVALTLGCTRFQALWHVALPAARRGMVAAFCIAWARSLGEFGPILVFAGATRMKTEVLPTTVWLELSVGNLEAAVAVSLFMVLLAVAVLVVVRATGEKV
jgi:molybdate transport system permease protein